MLVVKPINIARADRIEMDTHMNVFVITQPNVDLKAIDAWIDEQSFVVVTYQGWRAEYFFENQADFIATKLMFAEYKFHIPFAQPAKFDDFMQSIRLQNRHYTENMESLLKKRDKQC